MFLASSAPLPSPLPSLALLFIKKLTQFLAAARTNSAVLVCGSNDCSPLAGGQTNCAGPAARSRENFFRPFVLSSDRDPIRGSSPITERCGMIDGIRSAKDRSLQQPRRECPFDFSTEDPLFQGTPNISSTDNLFHAHTRFAFFSFPPPLARTQVVCCTREERHRCRPDIDYAILWSNGEPPGTYTP